MSRVTGPTQRTVELVWDREGAACARCGRSLRFEERGFAWSIHHRVGRGMGGTRNAWVNLPGALVAICGSAVTGCHGFIEANRQDAYDTGWLVRRHSTDLPADIPIQHARHGYGWLTDTGGFDPHPTPFRKD